MNPKSERSDEVSNIIGFWKAELVCTEMSVSDKLRVAAGGGGGQAQKRN
jgi:hypothetical protein